MYTDVSELIPGLDAKGLSSIEEAIGEPGYSNRFISYGNPLAVAWSELDLYRISHGTKLAYDLVEIVPEAFQYLEKSMDWLKRFQDQVVIDLGAGDEPWGYSIASLMDASAYVAVEPFHFEKLFFQDFKSYGKGKNIPYAIVPEDMATFLERLPDNSVSVLVCAIEEEILPDKKYRERVEKRIPDVIHPDGVCISSLMKTSLETPKTYIDNRVLFLQAGP